MKVNYENFRKSYPRLKELDIGDVFIFPNTYVPFMKGCMVNNDKLKIIDLETGKIKDTALDVEVIPCDATLNITRKD